VLKTQIEILPRHYLLFANGSSVMAGALTE